MSASACTRSMPGSFVVKNLRSDNSVVNLLPAIKFTLGDCCHPSAVILFKVLPATVYRSLIFTAHCNRFCLKQRTQELFILRYTNMLFISK